MSLLNPTRDNLVARATGGVRFSELRDEASPDDVHARAAVIRLAEELKQQGVVTIRKPKEKTMNPDVLQDRIVLEACDASVNLGEAVRTLGLDTRNVEQMRAFGEALDRLTKAGKLRLAVAE